MYNDELYHHGILGQKWGKKNGPPYPLDESDHSASEKKAGWRKSISSKEKAKKYERDINDLLRNEENYLLNYWMLDESKAIMDEKVNNLKFNNKNQKKIDRYLNKSNVMSMKMEDIDKKYMTNRKELNKLFSTIKKDKDVVYKKVEKLDYVPVRKAVRDWYKSDKNHYDLKKDLNKKYGRNLYYAEDRGIKSVKNDRFIVKEATDKNKNKYKYNKPGRDELSKPKFKRTYYNYY